MPKLLLTLNTVSTGNYGKLLADFLYSNGHEVSVVNPWCINALCKK